MMHVTVPAIVHVIVLVSVTVPAIVHVIALVFLEDSGNSKGKHFRLAY